MHLSVLQQTVGIAICVFVIVGGVGFLRFFWNPDPSLAYGRYHATLYRGNTTFIVAIAVLIVAAAILLRIIFN